MASLDEILIAEAALRDRQASFDAKRTAEAFNRSDQHETDLASGGAWTFVLADFGFMHPQILLNRAGVYAAQTQDRMAPLREQAR